MYTFNLRPHHALCALFFTGHGYSPEFTRHMEKVLSGMREGAGARLCSGADELCSACPNLEGGVCNCSEKVDRYDAATLGLLGIKPGEEVSAAEFRARAIENIILAGRFGDVCPDCQWRKICNPLAEKLIYDSNKIGK